MIFIKTYGKIINKKIESFRFNAANAVTVQIKYNISKNNLNYIKTSFLCPFLFVFTNPVHFLKYQTKLVFCIIMKILLKV